MTSIILVSGSLRRDSLNSALLATARRVIGERDSSIHTSVLEIGSLPYFNDDVDGEDAPPPVVAARAMVEAADAMLICTPSYNGAPPGALKNAVDWLSRPAGEGVLTDVPVFTMSASPGSNGAAESQEILRDVLDCAGAAVFDHPIVAVAKADLLPCRDGELVDPALSALLVEFVDGLLSVALPEPEADPVPSPEGPLQPAGTPAV
ncbi:NADPH-dependent FMN reductase [Streptomyces sp. TS71-3]|uniref:NADPH-dependent FMN reductase n=1 Tax=Streptomyces sp. TS71-3 TaxID=2733862 RepID=UPI001B0272C2|nr:NAD(P)H-dependent oxidoreductase [Streptomyces sp. TS71-3]GHJ37125.1 oxidoreductase [Streptomyces sp. TS71-3]